MHILLELKYKIHYDSFFISLSFKKKLMIQYGIKAKKA